MSLYDRTCPSMSAPLMDAEIEIVMLDSGGKMRQRRVVPVLELITTSPTSELGDRPARRHTSLLHPERL